MTREFFNMQFTALLSVYVYAQKIPDYGQDVYWEMLRGIPAEAFAKGVKRCLATCKFFPTIAELGEASLPTKEELSSYKIPTKYGMDRVPLKVTWDEQVERLEKEQKSIEAQNRSERRKLNGSEKEIEEKKDQVTGRPR